MVTVAPYSITEILWIVGASYVLWIVWSLLAVAWQVQREGKVYKVLVVSAVGFGALVLVNTWLPIRVGEVLFVVGMEMVAILWVIQRMCCDGGKPTLGKEVDPRQDWFKVRDDG